MKKLLILLLITTPFCNLNAQHQVVRYMSSGLSITNNNAFKETSFPSFEVGIMFGSLGLGASFGRDNIVDVFKYDKIENYWYEGKLRYSAHINEVIAYGLLGLGNNIKTKGVFLEYGLGMYRNITRTVGFYSQLSNWNNENYISFGLIKVF